MANARRAHQRQQLQSALVQHAHGRANKLRGKFNIRVGEQHIRAFGKFGANAAGVAFARPIFGTRLIID